MINFSCFFIVLLILISCKESENRNEYQLKPNGTSYTNSIGMCFVKIPKQSFSMGSSKEELWKVKNKFEKMTGNKLPETIWGYFQAETPKHTATVTKNFYISKYETTVGQFKKFINETNYITTAEKAGQSFTVKDGSWKLLPNISWKNPNGDNTHDSNIHPVRVVSWEDVQAFIDWLNNKENTSKYRLPTEAEWELAAKNGNKHLITTWDDTIPPKNKAANVYDESAYLKYHIPFDANYSLNSDNITKSIKKYMWHHHFIGYNDKYPNTAPVGLFTPNSAGIYDMVGNVWEWCNDAFSDTYYQNSPTHDPQGINPDDTRLRSCRGGSWSNYSYDNRISYRNRSDLSNSFSDLGFRIIREE